MISITKTHLSDAKMYVDEPVSGRVKMSVYVCPTAPVFIYDVILLSLAHTELDLILKIQQSNNI